MADPTSDSNFDKLAEDRGPQMNRYVVVIAILLTLAITGRLFLPKYEEDSSDSIRM